MQPWKDHADARRYRDKNARVSFTFSKLKLYINMTGSVSQSSSIREPSEQQQQRRPLIYKRSIAGHDTDYPDNPGYGSFIGALHSGLSKSGASTPKFTKAKKRLSNATKPSYWSYYVPVCNWLPTYSTKLLLGDLVAGLTLTCLLVPQSMSYASGLAHLDPVNGR